MPAPQGATTSAKEAFDIAVQRALQWQEDAALLSAKCSEQNPLDSSGRSPVWSFVFYSRGQNSSAVIDVRNGQSSFQVSHSSAPAATIELNERIIWNSKRIYDAAIQAAGNPDLASMTVSISLVRDPNAGPVWNAYFIDKNSHQTRLVQRIDANSGRPLNRQ
jgi:hypothetical protein